MKKTYYTNAPAPSNEDYQLPWFLKDDEKYVELMAAVASMLHAFPASKVEDWARLNEAYSQVVRGPHIYESASGLVCMWCQKGFNDH